MICPNCGAYVSNGTTRCSVCGETVNGTASNVQNTPYGNVFSDLSQDNSPWSGYYRKMADPIEKMAFWKKVALILTAATLFLYLMVRGSMSLATLSLFALLSLPITIGLIVAAIAHFVYIYKLGAFCDKFTSAFIGYIVAEIAAVIGDVVKRSGGSDSVWNLVKGVAEIAAMYFLYKGFQEICNRAELPEYAAEWKRLFGINVGLLVVALVGTIASAIVSIALKNAAAILLFAIGILVCEIVVYILEIRLLNKTAERLRML